MFNKAISNFYKFRSKNKRNEKLSYYLVFTAVFLFMLPLIYGYFVLSHKSLIFEVDGVSQHYPALAYWGHYLRQAIKNIFSGNFTLPLWDFSFGYGADIFTTLGFYVVLEPFSLLAVFVPQKNTELLYNLLVILRIYCAGIAFSVFSRRMKTDCFSSLCASIIYMFCGYSLYSSIRHPFFITPMILLPLILTGVEKILNKEKPYVFIIYTFIACVTNYYFFYMIIVLTVIYILIRCLYMYKIKKFQNLAVNAIKFLLYGIISLMLAAPIFIPNILAMLNTSRAGTKTTVDFFYRPEHYIKFISSFAAFDYPSNWLCLNFTSIAFVSVVFMFLKRKINKPIKAGFIVLTLIALFPFCAYIMHGFSYVSNRWVFGYGFLIAFIVARMLPDLLLPKVKEVLILMACSVIYFVFILIEPLRNESAVTATVIIMIFCIVILIFYMANTGLLKGKLFSGNFKLTQKIIMLFLCIAGVAVNAMYIYSPEESFKYINKFQNNGTTYFESVDTAAAAISKIKKEDNSFFRYESNTGPQNTPIVNNVYGVSYFYSIGNPNISQFLKELSLNNNSSFHYSNMDSRAIVDIISGVKYYVNSGSNKNNIPYGFGKKIMTYKSGSGKKYEVYKNKNYLPFGYTYAFGLDRSSYEKLNSTQKQQAMLQAAVLDDTNNEKLLKDVKDLLFSEKEIDYELKYSNGISFKNNKIVVSKASAKITLLFEGLENTETYLAIDNLFFESKNPADFYYSEDYKKLSLGEKLLFMKKHLLYVEPERSKITVKEVSAGVTKSQFYATPRYPYYSQKSNYIFNMDYSKKAKREITISFNQEGIYTFDNISVICQPVDQLSSQTALLKQDILENVRFSDNKITGQISLNKSKILSLSVPYNKGWTAYVNGKKTELIRVNTMFSGLILDAGVYDIELRYFTPGLKIGFVCFFIGLLLFLLIFIYMKVSACKENMKSREN